MSGSPPHVLLLITSSGYGGAETVMAEIALRRHQRGLPTSVCSLRPPGAVARRLAECGVPIFSLHMSPALRLREMLAARARLARWVRERRVTVVHAHLSRSCLLASILKIGAGPGPLVVSTFHATSATFGKGRWLDRAMWWTMRLITPWTDCFIAVSAEVAEALRHKAGIPPAKLRTIRNGVDAGRFSPRAAQEEGAGDPRRPLVIGSLGRLSRGKGYDTLLRAFARLAEAGYPVRCLLVGGGEEEAALRALTARLGLNGQVCLRGFSSRPQEVLREMDLFVLPSLEEGLPMVLLEAMATALPVVATEVGSVSRVVENGATGLLVPPGDPEALGEALVRLVSDAEARRRMGTAARRRVVEQFSVEAMVAAYESLFTAPRELWRRGR